MTVRTQSAKRPVEVIEIIREHTLRDEPLHHGAYDEERDAGSRDKPVHQFRRRRIVGRLRARTPCRRHEALPVEATERHAKVAKLAAMTVLRNLDTWRHLSLGNRSPGPLQSSALGCILVSQVSEIALSFSRECVASIPRQGE